VSRPKEQATRPRVLLWVTTGLMHRNKQPLRSITSSAAPSSEGG
jgi:hypothetical protein